MLDGRSLPEWAAETAMLLGEYGRATTRGIVADQCNRVASRLLASVSDTLADLEVTHEALADLIEVADGTLAMLDAKRKAGDFDHWESFEMSDFAVSIQNARAALSKVSQQQGTPQAQGQQNEGAES